MAFDHKTYMRNYMREYRKMKPKKIAAIQKRWKAKYGNPSHKRKPGFWARAWSWFK